MDTVAVRPHQDFGSLLSSVKRIALEIAAPHAADVDAEPTVHRQPHRLVDPLAGVVARGVLDRARPEDADAVERAEPQEA